MGKSKRVYCDLWLKWNSEDFENLRPSLCYKRSDFVFQRVPKFSQFWWIVTASSLYDISFENIQSEWQKAVLKQIMLGLLTKVRNWSGFCASSPEKNLLLIRHFKTSWIWSHINIKVCHLKKEQVNKYFLMN